MCKKNQPYHTHTNKKKEVKMDPCCVPETPALVKSTEGSVLLAIRKLGLSCTTDDPVYDDDSFSRSIPREIELTGLCAEEVAERVKSCVIQDGYTIGNVIVVVKVIPYSTVDEDTDVQIWWSLYFHFIAKK